MWMKNVNRVCIIFCFSLLISVYTWGQSATIEFDHYTTKDGLSNGYVSSILHDYRGFIWTGTINGLNRFDGINFKNYYFDPKDSTTISGSGVNALIEDSQHNIWVMTTNGICVYDRNQDHFSRKTIRVNGSIVNNLFLNTCFIDSKGFFWFTAANTGIYRFHLNDYSQITNQVIDAEMFMLEEADVDNVYKNNVYSIVEDQSGQIWMVSYSNQLFTFDQNQNKIISHPINHSKAGLFSNNRKAMIIGHNDNIFITIEQVGFLEWDRQKNQLTLYQPNDSENGPRGLVLFALCEDKEGAIWIGDRNAEGISIFNQKTKKFTYCKSEELDPYSLNTNKINCIYVDKNSSVWVGGIIGINKYSPGKQKFKRYYSNPNQNNRLSLNNTLCFEESKTGDIWIGTDGGGLNKFNRETDKFIHYKNDPTNPNSLSSNAIISICEDHEGTVWIGTFNGGLCRFKNNQFTTFLPNPNDPFSISNINIWYVFEDSKKNLWVATLNSGLELFDRKTNRFYHYTNKSTDSTSICSNTLVQIYEDSNQQLYITTYVGLSIIDLKAYDFSKGAPDIKFRNVYHDDNNNSLSSNEIFCTREDNKGNIWFGMMGNGIDKLDPKTGQFTNYSILDGLPGNSVSSILVDNSNNLWLGTDKGLAKFNPDSKEIAVFDQKEGLQNNSLKSWAITTTDGEMFFGGPNGFNSFYPESIKYNQNKNKPPVIITGLKIFNIPVEINEKVNDRIILSKNITETDELELTYKENYFSFEFISLDYTTPEKNNYAYMMEGFDHDWVYCGNKREANYTNLDPGKYNFKLIASNNDGVWNETGTSLKIIILPPWWDTWWFKSVFILVLMAVLTVIYFSRIQNLRKQKLLLEKLVAEKTAELQHMNIELNELNATKDKFFSIIAHDLKTPFNAIVGFSDLLTENFNTWNDQMKHNAIVRINSASKNLIQLLENLLQWSSSQRGSIEFNPVNIHLNEVFKNSIELLRNSADSKNIDLSYRLNDKDLTVHADHQMLDAILRNLIGNAIKFTNSDGKVILAAKIENEFVKIEVTDNGIGILPHIKEQLLRNENVRTTPGTKNEKGTGLGLILARDFVKRHGGIIGVNSTTGKGSTFYFTLPKSQ